jgi:ParB family chromosome partitioning protein
MIGEGASVAGVAARFGATENTVARRMKFGRLAPAIIKDFRADKVDLETAAAYALTDDQEAQTEAYKALGGSRAGAWRVREHFTQGHIPVTDKRVKLVGVEAYEAAGGVVLRDLLDDQRASLADAALLDRLAMARMEAGLAEIEVEGWKWAAILPPCEHVDHAAYPQRVYPLPCKLGAAEQKKLDRLTGELEQLEAKCEGESEDEEARAEWEKMLWGGRRDVHHWRCLANRWSTPHGTSE